VADILQLMVLCTRNDCRGSCVWAVAHSYAVLSCCDLHLVSGSEDEGFFWIDQDCQYSAFCEPNDEFRTSIRVIPVEQEKFPSVPLHSASAVFSLMGCQ
jgi:hypothetical protein